MILQATVVRFGTPETSYAQEIPGIICNFKAREGSKQVVNLDRLERPRSEVLYHEPGDPPTSGESH